MIYIQTTINITEDHMDRMAQNAIDDLDVTLDDFGYPTTKEIKIAILKEALKKILEKELDN